MVSAEKSEAICILWGSGAGMEGPWRDLRTHLPAWPVGRVAKWPSATSVFSLPQAQAPRGTRGLPGPPSFRLRNGSRGLASQQDWARARLLGSGLPCQKAGSSGSPEPSWPRARRSAPRGGPRRRWRGVWPRPSLWGRPRLRLETFAARRRRSCWNNWRTWRWSFPSCASLKWQAARLPSFPRSELYANPLLVFSPSLTRLRKRTSGNSIRARSTNPWICGPRKRVPCAADSTSTKRTWRPRSSSGRSGCTHCGSTRSRPEHPSVNKTDRPLKKKERKKEKAEEPEIKLPISAGSSKKQESSRKTSTFALLTMPKLLTVWITTNCEKFFKRWECQTAWPASWEICM